MPKKTKREKVIAQYRRKLTTVREQPVSSYVYQAKPVATLHTTTDIQPVDRLARRDLVKTLILAAVAIGGEVALSFLIR